jgi:ParB-like chromosome segregation protein Spo0J
MESRKPPVSILSQNYEVTDLSKLTVHPENPRRGDVSAIADSINAHGFYGAVVAQRSTGYVLAGNHRLLAAQQEGLTELPVVWVDVDEERARRILIADNRTSDLGTYDDALLIEILSDLALTEESLGGTGYSKEDLNLLAETLEAAEAELEPHLEYSRKTDAIIYEPTAETPPPVSELVDRTKADALTEQINAADLPDEVREFLIAGAQRHLVFDYAKVAEFYAHADPELQALMEASALVIIDLEDAIENGYVRLSSRLQTLLGKDLEERDRRDGAAAAEPEPANA